MVWCIKRAEAAGVVQFTVVAFRCQDHIAMLKYGIEDIRSLYTNDVRFLSQFTNHKRRKSEIIHYEWLNELILIHHVTPSN